VLIADEVGMGKTRVVMSAIFAVLKNGGSVAAVVPPGLLLQWKKEWEQFLHSKETPLVKGDYGRYAPILLRSYDSMFGDAHLEYPLGQNNYQWLLISHRFNIPHIKPDNFWLKRRYVLPIYAAHIRAREDRNARNEFANDDYWARNCLMENGRSKHQVKTAAEYLSNKLPTKLRNMPNIHDVENAISYFKSGKDMPMIGALLGPIDLLVIDEAHKSRDTSEDQTQLNNLLCNILKYNKGSKRIALTATPMELSEDQWETIFDRIGEEDKFPRKEIKDFAFALIEGNNQSDKQEKVRYLIKKSIVFNEGLRPFVTRRRRTKQNEFIALIGEEACYSDAHPHRDWQQLKIEFDQVESCWQPAVFGWEAVGKVAKGLSIQKGDKELNSLIRMLKIMDSRYAAGQICKLIDTSDFENKIDSYLKKESCDPFVLGKLNRIKYWLSIIHAEGSEDLTGHPRVQKMADAIENLVWRKDGELNEKVLVFGTFKRPLKALRDVLNRRAVLRILDRKAEEGKDIPLPGANTSRTDIENIWKEYKRIKESLTRNKQFSQEQLTQEILMEIISKAGKAYKNLQAKIEDHINVDKFVKTLPGGFAIKKKKLGKKTVMFLRSRLINDMICGKTTYPKNIKMRALEIWVEFLNSFFDTEAGDRKSIKTGKTEWKEPSYFNEGNIKSTDLQKLNDVADNMGSRLVGPLEAELEDTSNRRFGSFARMLDGDMEMENRHILQALFNNKKSFPMVLIAQSQVGREGLNLHEACRTVLQFHPEWNPGVIEQQIGRVDRINSFWEKKAKLWKEDNDEESEKYKGPKIIVMPIIFEGTYDAFQYGVSKRRRETLNAHLFGELLNDEALEKMPEGGEWTELREQLIEAAPDFSPPPPRRKQVWPS